MGINLQQSLLHYVNTPTALIFLVVVAAVLTASILIMALAARVQAGEYVEEDRPYYIRDKLTELTERYEELIIAGLSITLFVGIYFMIDYFGAYPVDRQTWDRFGDFILLGMILLSVILNTVLDHLFLPLKHISDATRSALRFTGMIYMIVIFAYIKFIYEDNNYDTIIMYFLGLLIGRFVYFDTSWSGFVSAIRDALLELPILGLVLGGVALISWYGFGSGYLLRSNGVVMSLFIAHLYMLVILFVLRRVHFLRLFTRIPKPAGGR